MGNHIKDFADPNVDRVIIYAGDGRCYWAENGCGYTTALRAGVYTRAEAYRLAGHCGPEKKVELHNVPTDHLPTLHARIAQLERELAEARRDSERLRIWFSESQESAGIRDRAQYARECSTDEPWTLDQWREAIDAAIRAARGEK